MAERRRWTVVAHARNVIWCLPPLHKVRDRHQKTHPAHLLCWAIARIQQQALEQEGVGGRVEVEGDIRDWKEVR